MKRRHWFYWVSNGILCLFLSIIVLVMVIAFRRQSGSTGLDMATIQKIRYEAIPKPLSPPPFP